MSDRANADICLHLEIDQNVISEGMIVDAEDQYGEWHLSIVCTVQEDESEFSRLNFLRYPKGNRDEWYTRNEVSERMAAPFSKVEVPHDETVITKLNNLREYFRKFKSKMPLSKT